MRTAPKIVFSLLISLCLFSGLAVAAYAGIFNILETRFYQSTVIASIDDHLATITGAMEAWHRDNAEAFAKFVDSDAVKRTLLPNQSSQDIFDRDNLAGALMAEMPGVEGIRIIDAGNTADTVEDTGKRRIHFSTFREDILKKEDFQISFKNYGDSGSDLPFSIVARGDRAELKIIADTLGNRFLYCYPFYDSYTTWRGTAVFYVTSRSANQNLVARGLFKISDDVELLASTDYAISGVVIGMPKVGKEILAEAIIDRWRRQDFSTDRIVSTDSSGWVLISKKAEQTGFVGEIAREDLFAFPPLIRVLFLVVSFLTLFLVVFLLFNLRQDHLVIIRNRIRRFQVQLLSEVMETTDAEHRDEIRKNLASRKHEINAEIKKTIGRRDRKKHSKEIDSILEKSWEEILQALGGGTGRRQLGTTTDDIRAMLEEVLQKNAINLNLTGVPVSTTRKDVSRKGSRKVSGNALSTLPVEITAASDTSGEIDELEDAEVVDEAEAVEELEDVEVVDEAEAVEELEEVDVVDEAEAVEELEDAEGVDEAEAVEELEDAEGVDEAEAVEELEDAEVVDEAEAVEELEEVEVVNEAEAVEELEDAEAIEDVKASEDDMFVVATEEARIVGIDTDREENAERLAEVSDIEIRDEGTSFAINPFADANLGLISEPAESIPILGTVENPDRSEVFDEVEQLARASVVGPDSPPSHSVPQETATLTHELLSSVGIRECAIDGEKSVSRGEGFVPEAIHETEALDSRVGEPESVADQTREIPNLEPDDVEYLEGEWEPDLLEVATEEELAAFIDEVIPDTVLVYNFEEKPRLDTGRPVGYGPIDTRDLVPIDASGLDFSSLDSLDTENVSDVDYIDTFLLDRSRVMYNYIAPMAREYLEVIGEDEPEELLDLTTDEAKNRDSPIVNRDGIYLVVTRGGEAMEGTELIDPEFKELVESVLM